MSLQWSSVHTFSSTKCKKSAGTCESLHLSRDPTAHVGWRCQEFTSPNFTLPHRVFFRPKFLKKKLQVQVSNRTLCMHYLPYKSLMDLEFMKPVVITVLQETSVSLFIIIPLWEDRLISYNMAASSHQNRVNITLYWFTVFKKNKSK